MAATGRISCTLEGYPDEDATWNIHAPLRVRVKKDLGRGFHT